MTWDDKLEALARKVYEGFGDGALGKAYLRALTSAPAAAIDDVPETLLGIVAAVPEAIAHTKLVNGADSAAALKTELRRFLRPD